MPIRTELIDGGATVRISPEGRFDFSCHGEFRKAYTQHDSGLSYVVDLRSTEYVDSSALGMLLLLRKHAGDTSRVKLLNAKPEVRSILDVVNFGSLFAIE